MHGLFDGTPLARPVTCERCELPRSECRCPRDAVGRITLPRDQPARVSREKRRGKWTTVITGLDPSATDLQTLLAGFQRKLAAGATLRDDGFELQGDHRDRIVADLIALGYPAKPAGG